MITRRAWVVVLPVLTLWACPDCLRVSECQQDSDCPTTGYCRVEEGICAAASERKSDGGVAASSSSSRAGTSSSEVMASSSAAQPSSMAPSSTSLPFSSSAAARSSSAAPSSSAQPGSSSAAPSSTSMAVGSSSASSVVSSSSAAASSASAGMSSSMMAVDAGTCADSPRPPACPELDGPVRTLGNADRYFAPKSADLGQGLGAVFAEFDEQDIWWLRSDGGMSTRGDTSQTVGGPPATLPSPDGMAAPLLVVAAAGNRVRLYELASDLTWRNSTHDGTADQLAPVVLNDPPNGLVVVPTDQQFFYVFAARLPTVVNTTASLGTAEGPMHAARVCLPGEDTLFVADAVTRAGFYRATMQPDGGVSAAAVGGELGIPGVPAQPPVVVVDSAGTLQARLFHHSGADLAITTVGGAAVESVSSTSVFLTNTAMSGSAAVGMTMVNGLVRRVVAIPRTDGLLTVLPFDGTPQADWPVASNLASMSDRPLSGVIALRLFPQDSSDTFLVGDRQGRLHAFKDGQERTEWGWPVTLPHAIRHAPLAIPWNDDGRLSVVVALEDGTTGRYQLLKLGIGSDHANALTWPEYQRDSANSGCLQVTQEVTP